MMQLLNKLYSTISIFLKALINPKKSLKDGVKQGKCLYRPGFTLKRVDKKFIKDLIYKEGKFKNGKCEWPQKKTLKDNKCKTSLVNVGCSIPAYFHIAYWNMKFKNW